VIDEAYRRCTEVPDGAPKRYRKGVEPLVDRAIDEHGVKLHPADPIWRDVVNALCEHEEFRLAEIAQRHAAPVLEDLIAASRSDQVQDMFAELKIQTTAESVSAVFARYIYDAIRKYPILNQPTKLDFGSAHHRSQPSGSGPDRLGRLQSPDRDDVSARPSHSCP
jgi:intracellular multiplication protein IcmB